MVTKKIFDTIEEIDKNLKDYFSSMNQTELEVILSRLAKLTEEVWELNSDVLKKYYKRKIDKFSEENLELEFADVFITLSLLAKSLDIDLNQAIEKKLKIINERWWI